MKLLNFKNVLCLSPHPDDVEISMSGSILKCKDTFFNICYLSNGTKSDPTSKLNRFDEGKDFWRKEYKDKNTGGIDLSMYNCLNVNLEQYLFFIGDMSEDVMIQQIEMNYQIDDYDAIFIPAEFDTHFEHRIVNSIGKALVRNNKISLIEYKSGSVTEEWIPNMFIDVSEQIEEKLKRLKCFKSQKKDYLDDDYLFVFHEHLQSRRKVIAYVEQFKIISLYE